ncbi:RdRp [Erinnyis ello cypovirus 2]|nr:RdRp [Erinnyis ello cypovirus 2]
MAFDAIELKTLQKTIDNRVSNRAELFKFLKYGTNLNKRIYSLSELKNLKFTGDVGFGDYTASFIIPNEIINPPDFNRDWYKTNANNSDFLSPPYNYVPTFRFKSFIDQEKDFTSKELFSQLSQFFLEDQVQTRGGDIWRNLAGVVDSCDYIYGTEDYPLRHLLSSFLQPYDQFPFYFSKGRFVFNDEEAISIFPHIIYMITSCIGDLCIGNSSHIESIIIISNYLCYAETSLLDNQLKFQKHCVASLLEDVSNLKAVEVPLFSLNGILNDVIIRSVEEPKWIRDTFKSDLYLELTCKQTVEFITTFRSNLRTIDEVIYLHTLCRLLSNTRLYLVSIPELSRVKGSQPRIERSLLKPPMLKKQSQSRLPLEFEVPTESTLEPLARYLSCFERAIGSKLADLNFNSELIFHYTTRSGGRKITDLSLIPMEYDKIFRLASNKRIVLAALESEHFTNIERFYESLKHPVMLGGRNQIRRRQRQIFIIGNEMFMLHFPLYRIEKAFTRKSPHASVGKQTGSYLDVLPCLLSTSHGWLSSAMDVSGMDASIQEALRLTTSSFCLNVSKYINNNSYGPFFSEQMYLDSTDGINPVVSLTSVLVGAVTQAIAVSISYPYKSMKLESKIFGEMYGQNQTYGSGLPSTSDHHIVALVSALRGSEMAGPHYCNTHSTRAKISIMGDDLLLIYVGDHNKTSIACQNDAKTLHKYGFEVDESASINTGEFLQQLAICGRYVGYSDRISLFTAERPNYKSTPSERCAEDFAIFSDMISRCYNTRGLATLLWRKSAYTNRRITLKMSGKDINELIKAKTSIWHGMTVRFSGEEMVAPLNDWGNTLKPVKADEIFTVQIYLPIIWLFLTGGGELPWPELIGNNGVRVPAKTMYGPRGPACNRLLFQLCDDPSVERYSDLEDKLDLKTLQSFGADYAYNLAQYNLTNLREHVRDLRVNPAHIAEVSNRLTNYLDQTSIQRSRDAFNMLNIAQVKIDRSLVYAYNVETRIKNALYSTDIDRYEYVENNEKFQKIMMQATKRINVDYSSKSGLALHAYRCKLNTELPRTANRFPELNGIALSASTKPGSEGWQLLQQFGFLNYRTLAVSSIIAKLTGKYAYFKEDDKAFETAKYIFNTHHEFIDIYFDAINLPTQTRDEYIALLRTSDDDKRIYYPYTLTNRQLFFINNNVMEGKKHYADKAAWVEASRKYSGGYAAAAVYLFLLSHAFEWYGEKVDIEW